MSVSSLTQSERTELKYVDIIQLVQITLPSGLILYFSDIDYYYDYTSDFISYDSYIAGINGLGNVVELDNVVNQNVNIVLKNKPWGDYSYLINLNDDDEFTRAEVSIYEVRPLSLDEIFSSDIRTLLWKGNVKQIDDICLDTFKLVCCSRLHNKKNAFNLQTVDEDTFPRSHPPDRGKYRNKIYGTVEKVPARNIRTGAIDKLAAKMNKTQTSITLSGSNEIDFNSSGTVQIDLEIITYTGVTTTGDRQTRLTGCTRGAGTGDGAVAAKHEIGAYVGQVISTFIYEVADHPVKEITNVFVDDVRQTSTDIPFNSYTGQTGNEYPGYEETAVVVFTVQPYIGQQVNVDVDDHSHSTNTGSHTHGGTSAGTVAGGRGTGDSSNTIPSYHGGTLYNESNAWDGNSSTYAHVSSDHTYGFGEARINVPFTVVIPSGYTSASMELSYWMSSGSSATYTKVSCNGHGQTRYGIYPYGRYTFSFVDTSLSAGTHTVWAQMAYLGTDDGNYTLVKFGELALTVTYSSSNTGASPATGVSASAVGTTSLTGGTSTSTIVIGDEVTVDVKGYQDDSSGTYTGTASALITKPDSVLKHLLIYQAGFDSTDIDDTTFNESRTFYNDNTFKHAFVLHDIGTESDKICGNLAFQCRSSFYEWYGKFHLKLLPDSTPTPGMNIFNEDIIEYPIYSFTDLDDIKNYLRGFYLRDYRNTKGGSSLEGVLNPDALAEGYMDILISSTGDADLKDDLHFNAIRLADMAQDVLDYWLDYKSTVKLNVQQMKIRWKGIQIGPGDYFTYNDPMFGSRIYRVTSFNPDRSSGFISISGIEET